MKGTCETQGGHIEQGETPLQAAMRELYEESGLKLSPEKGMRVFSKVRNVVNGVRFADILDVWLFEYDGLVSLEQATTHEVAQVTWMSKAQIRELFDAGKLVHTLQYFFDGGLF